MLPTTHSPVLTPMPMPRGLKPTPAASAFLRRRSLKLSIAVNMSSAASIARPAWSGMSSGAFQNAMTASPMYLSIVPVCDRITSVSGVKRRLIRSVNPCGLFLNRSEIAVKPRTSQNRMVISLVSPPSFSCSGLAASCSTSAGDMYWLKAARTCRRSVSDCR